MNIGHVLDKTIVNVPDWPEPGIQFKDLTPVLQNPEVYGGVIDALVDKYEGGGFDLIAALDARGFWFGPTLAHRLKIGWIPIRKAGKLPRPTRQQSFSLEYGDACFEVHQDDLASGQNVLMIDDIIATGGTMIAAIELVRECGAHVDEVAAIAEICALGGREKIRQHGVSVTALVQY